MTVPASAGYSGPYLPNGVTVAFPFTFSAASAGEVQVQLDGVIVSTGFTVTLNSNQVTNPGGTVTFTTAPTGDALAILSDPDFSQEIAFTNAGPFSASSHDEVADQSARKDIALKRDVDRSLKVDLGATPPDYDTLRATLKGDPGGYAGDIGLLTQAPYLDIVPGIDIIATSGADILDHGGAVYVAGTPPTARSGFTSANGRNFVLSKEQTYNPRMFYQATDPDFQNAMQKSFDYLAAIGRSGDGYIGSAAPVLDISNEKFLFHDTLSLPCAIPICGNSTVLGGGSVLQWTVEPAGDFISILGWDGTSYHGTGSKLRNLTLNGPYTGTRSAKRAVYVNGTSTLENLFFKDFPGIAIEAFGDVGSLNGTVSESEFRNLYAQGCDVTLKLRGGDSQACIVEAIRGQANRFGSYWDFSFLGNAAGPIYAENCFDPAFPSRCHYTGFIHCPRWGMETWCSTHAPNGDGTHNAGWLCIKAGSANFYTPTWTTGQNWYFASSVVLGDPTDNGSTFARAEGCYIEDGMNPIIMGPNTTCTATTSAAVFWQVDGTPHGGNSRGDGAYMLFSGGLSAPGKADIRGAQADFGPRSGPALDLNFNLNTTNGLTLSVNRYNSAGALLANDGSFVNAGRTWYLSSPGGIHLRFSDVDVANAIATGLDLPASKVLSFNAVTVIDASRNASFVGVAATAAITSSGGGVGYATGAGGAVTQATSRTTGVTLNKLCGAITLVSAAGSATYQTFTVTNSQVAATDVIHVSQKSGADKYIILVTAVGAGSFDITSATTGGTTTEQPVFNFTVGKAVAA